MALSVPVNGLKEVVGGGGSGKEPLIELFVKVKRLLIEGISLFRFPAWGGWGSPS